MPDFYVIICGCQAGKISDVGGESGPRPRTLTGVTPTFLLQSDAARISPSRTKGDTQMLWTVAVVLIILWLLGLVTSYTMGGLIHILLVIAIVVVLLNVIQGRRA